MSTADQSIINKDVETYQIEVEYCESQLRRATFAEEDYWQRRLEGARNVLAAMKILQAIINE